MALARRTGLPPEVSAVRDYRTRTGVSFNLEQALSDHLGLFVRAGEADGSLETYEFADIDQTVAAGLSQDGTPWKRPDDKAGAAVVVNQISSAHQAYQAAGGTGILIGDGKLPHAGPEAIVEAYYNLQVVPGVRLGADYQFVSNPAYNRDRGAVSVLGLRLHLQQ